MLVNEVNESAVMKVKEVRRSIKVQVMKVKVRRSMEVLLMKVKEVNVSVGDEGEGGQSKCWCLR